MEHVQYMPREAKKQEDRIWLLKHVLFVYNFFIFVCACLLLGVSIYMAVDRNFMTYIIGNDLYAAAVFIALACGAIIFFISFLGCCGVVLDKGKMLIVYFFIITFIAIVLFICGILAIVFHTQIGDKVKSTMSQTLVEAYGVDFESRTNRAITDAWDKAQERLGCCGVDDTGWYLYRNSSWFKTFGAREEEKLTYEDQEGRPYVPQSCCVKDKLWRYVSLDVCRTWRLGPPGSPVDGAINRAVYYTGCFNAGVAYLKDNATILIVLALVIAILLIIGIVVSALIILSMRNQTRGSSTNRRGR